MRRIVPGVVHYDTPVRLPAPQAIAIALGLGRLFGRGINGRAGSVRYGYPAVGTRAKFGGYATPPQLFTGYDPRRVAAGTIRVRPASLPGTSSPTNVLQSPLLRATATISGGQEGVING